MISIAFLAQSRLPEISPEFFSSWIAVLLLGGGFVVMILSGIAMTLTIVEKLKAKKTPVVEMSPNPMQVQEVEKLATKEEMMSMETRLSNKITEVENDMAEERKVARTANGTLHRRIDELVETLAETKGLLTGVKENTERLLNRQLK